MAAGAWTLVCDPIPQQGVSWAPRRTLWPPPQLHCGLRVPLLPRLRQRPSPPRWRPLRCRRWCGRPRVATARRDRQVQPRRQAATKLLVPHCRTCQRSPWHPGLRIPRHIVRSTRAQTVARPKRTHEHWSRSCVQPRDQPLGWCHTVCRHNPGACRTRIGRSQPMVVSTGECRRRHDKPSGRGELDTVRTTHNSCVGPVAWTWEHFRVKAVPGGAPGHD